ncbi:MAG: sugar ABC transporter permease [Anaerolineae bacterium]|nr:sugar ABC transporter permease [Anaerolineae bacterium]
MATKQASATDFAVPEEEVVKPPRLVRWRPFLIALPALLILIGILYPFVVGVAYSFTAYAFTRPNTDFVFLRQYQRMVEDSNFLYSTFITLAYAVSATGVQLVLGLIVATLLNRDSRIAKILQTTLIFPMMVAPVIATLIWKMMMQPSVGILNPMLNAIGLPSLQWAAVPETALFSVVLVDVWMFTPFAALILLAGLRSFPQGPFEAARVDGASFWFTFRNLTLPMLTPFILIVIIFRFMDSLKMFDIIFAMTEGGPGSTLMTYQLTAYRTSIQFQKLAQGLPYAIVLYFVIYFVSQKLVNWWGRAQRRAAGYS